MSARHKSRTMYMHTMDGQPASFASTIERRGGEPVTAPYIHFVSRRSVAILEPSLRVIRMQQRATIRDAKILDPIHGTRWADAKRYGYVRVKVPV
jgi:hypothetical protein